MEKDVARVHGPRELHAVVVEGDLRGQPAPEHGGETPRRTLEDAVGYMLRIKPDRRLSPNGFVGSERHRQR